MVFFPFASRTHKIPYMVDPSKRSHPPPATIMLWGCLGDDSDEKGAVNVTVIKQLHKRVQGHFECSCIGRFDIKLFKIKN